MQQELDLSLSKTRKRRSAVGYICKIAFQTLPRMGTFALLYLTLGFYFLFSAGSIFSQIQEEKNQPYEITASIDSSYIDLNAFLQFDGIKAVSPILRMNSKLMYQHHVLQCEIKAVYSSYLDFPLVEGVIYPDYSNMPYLILNKNAAESFSLENKTIAVHANNIVSFSSDSNEHSAMICGVFDDGKDIPTVYMSYETAKKIHAKGSATELTFLLTNKGAVKDVISHIEKSQLSVIYDSDVNLTWDLMQKRFIQSIVTGITLCTCSATIIAEKRTVEIHSQKSEWSTLLSYGMTLHELKRIFMGRMIIAEGVCLLIATVIARITGEFTLISVSFCFGVGVAIILFSQRSLRLLSSIQR